MRFLADMGVSQRVVSWLRNEGHDALGIKSCYQEKKFGKDVLSTLDDLGLAGKLVIEEILEN